MSAPEDEVVLEDMTKTELQDHADELDIEYSESDTKAELIEKITAGAEPPPEGQTADEANAEEAAYDASPDAVPSEQFPERRPIEVDVADVPVEEHEGEFQAPLNAESWVILDGEHEGVPDRFDGAVAAVLDWPTVTVTDPDTGESHEEFPVDGTLIVQERSQGLRLSLPMEAFKEVHSNGRPSVLGYA